jgi:quercetin dioxygenase-like cupin family protein
VEILRFGPGFRRPEPPAAAQGLEAQTIWSDPRARITELAFSRRALIAPRSSPDHGLFIVVAGGGWVQVDDERALINHGEAVEWPPGVRHAAWTDGSTMRAILVEVPDVAVEGRHQRLADSPVVEDRGPVLPGQVARGGLAAREMRPEDHDQAEGEPW